jgi:predicted regulator of Ras-like GTPase activity (Roadblock/LC7/MglB family)
MDSATALSELLDLSTQVVEAVISSSDGTVEASHAASEDRVRQLAATGAALLAEAGGIRAEPTVERVHVDLDRGSVVVARDDDRTIVVTTVAEPTAGLVAYDLRTALRRAGGAAT